MAFNRQLSGFPTSPLAYTGSGPNMALSNRRPGQNDINYPLGFWWVIPVKPTGAASTDPSEEVWVLMSVAQGTGVWKRLRGGGGPNPPTTNSTINRIIFSTPGSFTYTPTSGMTQCYVECVGGGGGTSGLCSTLTTTVLAIMGGAGGGGYCAKLFTSLQIGSSQSLTVGSGGAGGAGPSSGSCSGSTSTPQNPGQAGSASTFGSFLTANGGGNNTIINDSGNQPAGPGVGGTATGGDVNLSGQNGSWFQGGIGLAISGNGGNSGLYGNGGYGITSNGNYLNQTSNNGTGFGGGGSGVMGNNTSSASYNGANGANGVVIITEYLE